MRDERGSRGSGTGLESRVDELENLLALTADRVDELETQISRLQGDQDGDQGRRRPDDDRSSRNGNEMYEFQGFEPFDAPDDRPGDAPSGRSPDRPLPTDLSRERRDLVESLRSRVSRLDEVQRGMLAYYREYGPAAPREAHLAAGGTGDRTDAYRHNATLRGADLIEHAGRGGYTPRIRLEIREAHDNELDHEEVERMAAAVEETLPPARPPATVQDWPDY